MIDYMRTIHQGDYNKHYNIGKQISKLKDIISHIKSFKTVNVYKISPVQTLQQLADHCLEAQIERTSSLLLLPQSTDPYHIHYHPFKYILSFPKITL